jgi:hypothetical protein
VLARNSIIHPAQTALETVNGLQATAQIFGTVDADPSTLGRMDEVVVGVDDFSSHQCATIDITDFILELTKQRGLRGGGDRHRKRRGDGQSYDFLVHTVVSQDS